VSQHEAVSDRSVGTKPNKLASSWKQGMGFRTGRRCDRKGQIQTMIKIKNDQRLAGVKPLSPSLGRRPIVYPQGDGVEAPDGQVRKQVVRMHQSDTWG